MVIKKPSMRTTRKARAKKRKTRAKTVRKGKKKETEIEHEGQEIAEPSTAPEPVPSTSKDCPPATPASNPNPMECDESMSAPPIPSTSKSCVDDKDDADDEWVDDPEEEPVAKVMNSHLN